MVMTDQVRHRRRGEELENALLAAAWEELTTAGFASLTMESVAARAKTGVAVLYRRWPNKSDLVLAAIDHYRRTHAVETPDTGTLRGDLLALLGGFSDGRSAFTTVMTAAFAGLQRDSGMTPAEVRGRIVEDRAVSTHEIYRRAHGGRYRSRPHPRGGPVDALRPHASRPADDPPPGSHRADHLDSRRPLSPLVAQFRPVAAKAGQDLRRRGDRRF